MSKSLQRGILFSICVALVLALSLTLVFFTGGGDKNILSAPEGQVSATAKNTTSYTHGSYIEREVPAGVKTVSTGLAFITAVSDNESVSLAGDITLDWNQFGIQAEGISGGWSVDTYTGTIYGNGYTVSLSGLNTEGEVYPARGFKDKAYAGGIVRELGNGGAIYDLNVSVDGHIRVLGASGQYLDLGILVGQMNSNSVIDNCTVTIKSGKKVESMKMSTSIPWARLGLFVGKFADNARNMRITNVTATHNGTIEVGLGTTSGWGGTPGGGNTDESAQGFAGLIFGAASKSATNITLDNIVVAGSGVIWSYAGAPIGMLMGNTAVTINNFFNKTTNGSLFKNIQDNRSSNTILDFERNGDNVQGRVVNHYRSSQAQQATADDNNGINVTNTITVLDDNIGKIYFDPTVSDYANSLTIVHDTTNAPVDSENKRVYTITGQNNYSATSEEITLNGSYDRVIFRNLSSTASNWNNGGNFGYNVTYKDTPRFNDYRADLKFYEHGYATSQTNTDTPISSGDDWLSHFGQNASGGGDSSSPLTGNYYLTKDIVISGFSGKFFNGTFDGNGHTIYITGVSQDSYGNPGIGGVIGTLMSGGSIKNMRVVLVNELTVNGPSNGRVGGVVGHIQGGTLENVTVLYDDTAALISETTSNDITIGGVAGRATSNAQIKNVTLEMEDGSRLAPKSGWTYLAGVVGIIDAANGATFENIVLRGTGNFNAHSDNDNQPPYYAAIANTKAEDYNGSDQYASIDGLIYDFDAQLNGTFQGSYGDGQDHCSMYYFFSNNWHNGSGSVGSYHNLVSYDNIFIAEGKGGNLAENVGDRFSSSSGNAPIMIERDTTINTVKGTVYGAAGSDVTAYFNPVDGDNDMIFRATRTTGSWMKDDMVQLVGSDGNLYQSAMEGDHSSPRLVYAPKGVAATNNVVQLTMPSNVFRPEFGSDVLPLTYNGQEQSFVFTLKLNNADQMPLTEDDFTVTYRLADASTGSLGSNSLPVNAGEYIATIVLKNGYKFIAEGQGTETDTYELTVEIYPYTVEINSAFDFDAAYGEIGLNGGVISGGKFTAENLFANYADLSSTFPADIPGIAEITVAAADSSQITASGAGKLPVGSYTVAAIKLDDTNFAATDYVEHLIAFEVTQKSVSAEITINETLPQYYDGNSLTPTVTADLSAAIESGDDADIDLKITVDSAEVDAILNAGTYAFDAELVGVDADNYILTPTFKTASGDEIASGEWTVKPYDLRIQWDFDSQVPLEYGDEISNDLVADTEILDAIPYNGGEYTGRISFTITSATYNGGTHYAPGVAVGTSVTFEVEAILPDIEGFIESNYNVILSGSASTLVEPRTLEINYAIVAENMEPLKYGEELSNDLLAERFNGSYTHYVSNIYNNEPVSFVVTWYESNMNPVTDFNEIVPNTAYYGRVQVASGFDNYRLPDNANDTYFEFMVQPKELTVTGVTWETGFDGVYDGQAHSVVVESDLIEGDVYNFVIDITDENGSPVDSVTDAGTYTVAVAADEKNLNYDLSVSDSGNEYTITIDPYDLAKATVTIKESGLVYTGSAITVTPIVKGGENDFTSKLTVVVNGGDAVVNAGDYTITASDTNNSGNFTGEATGTFEVAQKQLKLESLTLSSSTYTGAAITVTGHNFAEGFAPAGVEEPELVIALQGGGSVVNAGEYTYKVSLATDNDVNKNYVMADGAGTITATVSPASVTVTAGKEAKLGALHGEKATADTDRFYKSDFITLSPQPDETFTLSDALTFTVKNNETQEYEQAAEGAYTLAPGNYTVTYTIENVENANYTLTAGDTLTTTLTVKEGALKLVIERWDNTSPTYNGKAQLPTPVFADSAEIGEIEEGALVFTVTAKEGSSLTGSDAINAGSYTVTVSIAAGFEQKYELVGGKLSTDFTIKQREVVLNWKAVGDDDLVYDGAPHELTATVGNKVDGDVVTVSVKRLDGNNNTDVTPDGFHYVATGLTGNDAGNYKLPENKQSEAFKVTPKQVDISWNFVENPTIVYGDSVEDVKKLVNIGALNGTIPGVTGTLTFTVSVGNYSASTNAGTEVTFDVSYTLPEGAKANNYEITVKAAEGNTLTVGKAKVNLTTAESASLTKVYDGKAVTLDSLLTAGNVSVKGMKNGEDAFDLKILRISGKAGMTDMTNAALYDGIVIEIIKDCNYISEPLKIEYTITPKPIGVDWTDTAFEYDGTAHKPTATATELVGEDTLTLTVTGEKTNANAEGETYTATVKAFEQGNYKLEKDATVEFTISRKTVSVKWDDTELTYNGSAQKPTATVGEAQGLVTGDDLQITVSGEKTDVNTDGGSYTATAAIAGGADKDNYVLDESSVSTSFTIAPKPITITFTSDEGEAIEFDVAGSVTVGAWTADGSNKATLTLSDGTTNITLTVEASEALPKVENVPALWLLLDSKFYEGTPYGTKVEGGSLTVSSANANYVFEVTQAITINITPAISVGLKADVQTTTLGLLDVLKTDHNAEYFKNNYLQVTGKDGGEVTVGTLEVTITPPKDVEFDSVIKHAGTYTVTAVYTPKDAEGSAELPTFSFTFTVTPVEVTSVTYSGESLVYGKLSASGEIAVTVEYEDGKKAENVTAQYTSEHVSTGNWLKAGNTQVTVSYTGDNRDYAAVTEEIKLTVAQKTITATIYYREQSGTALTLTYKGSEYTIGAELNDVRSGDGVGAEVRESFTDVAAYEVEITLAGIDSGNYKIEGEYTVTITPADVTYEWKFGDGAKITYGDSIEDVKKLVNTAALDGKIPGVTDPLTFTVSATVNAGDYSATTKANTVVTFDVSYTLPEGATAENYNINITAANGNTLTVGKATLNLTIAESASLTKVYDGEAVTLNSLLTAGNVSVEGMKNGENAFTLGILAISRTDEMTNAGAYNGSVSVIDDCNYTAEPLQFSYKITPKPIGVAWSNTEFTYDGTAHKPTATATDLVDGDSLTLIVTGAETNAGSYTATVEAFEQGNYKLESDSTRTFTIKKAAAELAIKDYDAIKASVYKGSAFVVTPLLNGAEDTQGIVKVEFFDKTNSSAIVAVQEIKNAGTYTVTLTVNNANYEYAKSDFTVTVSPKPISVAWSNTEFTYDGTAHKPTATAEGLVQGDSLTLTVTGAQTNAGSYMATVAAFEQGNYKLESASTQTFTIKKADLTVTPASLEIRERETEVMQAFAEGEDLVEAFAGRINVSGVSGTVRYTVTIAGDNNYDDDGLLTVGAHTFTIDAGSNYNAASVSVTVIATPVVTVIASVEGELVYNGSAFEISYALKAGAPEDVSMDDITVTASVETIVNAGEYEVTFTVTGSNEDYDYVVQDASGNAALTFTVAQRGLDVAEVAEAVYGDLQVSGALVTGTHTAFVAYNDEEIELIVNVKTAALSRAAAEYLDAGEYEVTIALVNEEGNFSLNGATLNPETEKMEVESTLDVAPKSVTVGYTPSSKVYDAKGISVTIDKFEHMLIEGDDPAVNIYINDALYTGKVVLDAGEYTVRYESADPNYAFEPVSATFTVQPKKVTPSLDLNTGTGSQQITGGGKLEIEEGEETDIIAAIDNFMQSSGVTEEDLSISVSGDLKLEDMASWAPGTYKVTVALSGNHSGSIEFTVEVSEKIELPPPVQPELPETPVEAGSGNDWVLPLVIAIVALIDLALLVAIGVAAKKRA